MSSEAFPRRDYSSSVFSSAYGLARRAGEGVHLPMRKTLHLLLVEDSETDAVLIQQELRRGGYELQCERVDTAPGMADALGRRRWDLVISDCHLPNFSALAALELVRNTGLDLPVIVVTGEHGEEMAVAVTQAGAHDFLTKGNLTRLVPAVEREVREAAERIARRRMEEALRESESRFRILFEHSPEAIFLIDPHDPAVLWKVVECNAVACQQSGYSRAELIGQPVGLIDPKANKTARLQRHLDRLHQQETLVFESVNQRRDGSQFPVEVSISDTTLEGRQLILGIVRDITERKRAEREIKKLAAFPKYNPNPVMEFDADGKLTYFNTAAKELAWSAGHDSPEPIVPPGATEIVKECLATARKKLRVETEVANRIISWSFFPILANNVVHTYAYDITERVGLENQLRQSQKMEAVGQLAGGIAHDFNNLLTLIRGYCDLIQFKPDLPADINSHIDQVSQACERATNLTRQLLTFSRKQVMQLKPIDINDLVNNLTKMLQRLLGEQMTLELKLQRQLPAILADVGMLEQILVNLTVNSRDAMPRGGKLIIETVLREIDPEYCRLHADARSGHFVCLTVTDSGTGMDPATLARVFEPFFTTKEVGKGTGLGLSTVYGIVAQHRGWVTVYSELNRGTSFKIFLPISPKAAQALTQGGPARSVRGGTETILLVEDEPALRAMARTALENYGYKILEAASGPDALAIWAEADDQINLLFTDMVMPGGMTGRDLAVAIHKKKPGLKVLYSSGYSVNLIQADFALKEGVNFLAKPYNTTTLAQVVRSCLDSKTANGPLHEK
jgi:two-component system cell cycle sensor histidine kinase/response regulator CckA